MGKLIAVYFAVFMTVTMFMQFIYHSNKMQKINFLKITLWGIIAGTIAAVILTIITIFFLGEQV